MHSGLVRITRAAAVQRVPKGFFGEGGFHRAPQGRWNLAKTGGAKPLGGPSWKTPSPKTPSGTLQIEAGAPGICSPGLWGWAPRGPRRPAQAACVPGCWITVNTLEQGPLWCRRGLEAPQVRPRARLVRSGRRRGPTGASVPYLLVTLLMAKKFDCILASSTHHLSCLETPGLKRNTYRFQNVPGRNVTF